MNKIEQIIYEELLGEADLKNTIPVMANYAKKKYRVLAEKISSRLEPLVIKKICVFCWDEAKQTHFEIKELTERFTLQNIIPRRSERIVYDFKDYVLQYEVDWVEYHPANNEFVISVFINET